VPRKPTKDTIQINIELPKALLERLRKFAKWDHRTIKAEFILALESYLDQHDRSDRGIADTITQSTEQPSSNTANQQPVGNNFVIGFGVTNPPVESIPGGAVDRLKNPPQTKRRGVPKRPTGGADRGGS
jgi:hypothetical protein